MMIFRIIASEIATRKMLFDKLRTSTTVSFDKITVHKLNKKTEKNTNTYYELKRFPIIGSKLDVQRSELLICQLV